MNFVRKILCTANTEKTMPDENDVGLLADEDVSDDSTDNEIEAGLVDVFRIEKKLLVKTRGLKFKFRKHLKEEKKICRLQKHLIQTDKEMTELNRMLRQMDLQKSALEAEIECKGGELKDATCLVQMDFEVEVKKKEPLLFKRYNHIKSTGDAKSLLSAIKNKQTCLQHLELLTFKKYLNNHHDLKKDGRKFSDNVACITGPPTSKKPKRANFRTRFGPNSIFNPFQTAAVTHTMPTFPILTNIQNNPNAIELSPPDRMRELFGGHDPDLDGIDGINDVMPTLVSEV